MLTISNWTISNFKQKPIVLKDINLSFFNSQLTAIIGKSGVGKTTLLNSIANNSKIINGNLEFNHFIYNNNNKKDWNKLRKKIGMISQKSTLVIESSVFDNLKYVLSQKNCFLANFFNLISKNQNHQIYELLIELDILDKVFYQIKDLSGGETQRVEIAKLFIKKPQIILADEPTSNLDISNAKNIIKMLKKLVIKLDAIGVIVLHDISLLNENIDFVIGLKNHGVLFAKKPNEINKKELEILYGK